MTEEPLATRIEGKVATEAELVYALEVGIMCNDASISRSDGSITGAPIDAALLRAAVAKDLIAVRDLYRRVGEKPFSSETKIMVVECERDGVKTFFVKGAVETLLYLCTHIMSGGKLVAMGEGHRRRAEETSSYLGARLSRRALALARGPSMDQLEFVGLAAFQDPPRPRAAESVRTLHGSRVAVCMITGDSRETAASVAAAVAIPSEGRTLLSGDEVDKLGDKELEEIVEKIYCYYRTTPRHKVRIVKALQERGHIVGMTGDGVNDGVAIKKADVGICMGITGTDVCKEASDMILLDDDFSTILNAIEEGKCIFYNIRNFVRFQLSTSIAALMLISLSTLVNVPNPLNAMQILWINILMDGPPAQVSDNTPSCMMLYVRNSTVLYTDVSG
jgi:Ca2+-transporting ATPase